MQCSGHIVGGHGAEMRVRAGRMDARLEGEGTARGTAVAQEPDLPLVEPLAPRERQRQSFAGVGVHVARADEAAHVPED